MLRGHFLVAASCSLAFLPGSVNALELRSKNTQSITSVDCHAPVFPFLLTISLYNSLVTQHSLLVRCGQRAAWYRAQYEALFRALQEHELAGWIYEKGMSFPELPLPTEPLYISFVAACKELPDRYARFRSLLFLMCASQPVIRELCAEHSSSLSVHSHGWQTSGVRRGVLWSVGALSVVLLSGLAFLYWHSKKKQNWIVPPCPAAVSNPVQETVCSGAKIHVKPAVSVPNSTVPIASSARVFEYEVPVVIQNNACDVPQDFTPYLSPQVPPCKQEPVAPAAREEGSVIQEAAEMHERTLVEESVPVQESEPEPAVVSLPRELTVNRGTPPQPERSPEPPKPRPTPQAPLQHVVVPEKRPCVTSEQRSPEPKKERPKPLSTKPIEARPVEETPVPVITKQAYALTFFLAHWVSRPGVSAYGPPVAGEARFTTVHIEHYLSDVLGKMLVSPDMQRSVITCWAKKYQISIPPEGCFSYPNEDESSDERWEKVSNWSVPRTLCRDVAQQVIAVVPQYNKSAEEAVPFGQYFRSRAREVLHNNIPAVETTEDVSHIVECWDLFVRSLHACSVREQADTPLLRDIVGRLCARCS